MPAEAEKLAPDRQAMRRHLDHLFGHVADAHRDGLVEIAYTAPSGSISSARLFPIDHFDDAVNFAAAANAGTGTSVYVGMALRKPAAHKHRRAGEKDFHAAYAAWADFDEAASVDAAAARCRATAMPTFAIFSGRHPHTRLQLFWRLAEPIAAPDDIRALLSSICQHLDGDPKVCEPSRVMRLAGSIAWPHKEGRIAEMTGILNLKDPGPDIYAVDALKDAFPYTPSASVVDLGAERERREWGKAHDGREDAMTRFVWAVVVSWHRENPIMPTAAESTARMKEAWQEFRKTITTKDPAKTLDEEGRGEDLFGYKFRQAMKQWDHKVADAAAQEDGEGTGDDANRPALPPLSCIDVGAAAGLPIRPVQYIDAREMWARGYVHSFNGNGGLGKTTLAVQKIVAQAAGSSFLGAPIVDGVTVFFSAEERVDPLRMRIRSICEAEGIDERSLAGRLYIVDLSKDPAWLLAEGRRTGAMMATPLFDQVRKVLDDLKPVSCIFDNRMRLIRANQNSTDVAVDAVSAFDRLALEYEMDITLIGHPSLSGMNSGTGNSGTVAWVNTGRFMSYLRLPDEESTPGTTDDGRRLWQFMKNNFGRRPDPVELIWDNGRFRCEKPPGGFGPQFGAADRAERVFMTLLRKAIGDKVYVTNNPVSARLYAPSYFFAQKVGREGVTRPQMEKAMHELLARGTIAVEEFVNWSRRTTRLSIVENDARKD
ncbi:AAA family ATPase [Mesorhizobium sp. LHD-90]|uniref:AAA family ATPase n=1 Tax=Mesorhizobium sp. LHD-90 TaxID=3071414 RepID=UPI0027DFC211|nr:AAA family ATPase [Mesorhizobium sp. LHD-90]MDQ6434567.1 AAA family ATPase [Mesorhizobium sp. LHD-90]